MQIEQTSVSRCVWSKICYNSSSPAQSPEWPPSLQVSLPHESSLLWGWLPGMKPGLQRLLKLVGFVWMRRDHSVHSGPVACPFPPQWAYPVSRPEQKMSWRAVELTQIYSWAPGYTPRRRWEECECECVSSCGACRSSWNCVWRQRWPGPETRASCSSLRWSALQTLPGGRRHSLTFENLHEHPDGPLTRCPPHARRRPRFGLSAFASSAAPAECSVPGGGTEERQRDIMSTCSVWWV